MLVSTVAILNDSADDKPLLSGVTEGVFTAAAESDVRCLFLQPFT